LPIPGGGSFKMDAMGGPKQGSSSEVNYALWLQSGFIPVTSKQGQVDLGVLKMPVNDYDDDLHWNIQSLTEMCFVSLF
jgi:hypothetical protein